MTLTTIIIIILLGLVLIAVEIFFVPGTTVVGIAGAIALVAGIVCGFIYLDPTYGWSILACTTAFSVVLGYFAFSGDTWKKIAMKATIDSKIVDEVHSLQAGISGLTLTPCNPIGKAKFGDKIEEVYSLIDFIDTNTPIKIDSIKENKIFVTVIKS
jgi:membrane-bound ClpP family serine protease